MDLHINVVGGLLLSEPASDLAVALAIASSFHEQPIAADLAAIGEIGCGPECCVCSLDPIYLVVRLPVGAFFRLYSSSRFSYPLRAQSDAHAPWIYTIILRALWCMHDILYLAE